MKPTNNPAWKPAGALTARFNSSQPNIQNISRGPRRSAPGGIHVQFMPADEAWFEIGTRMWNDDGAVLDGMPNGIALACATIKRVGIPFRMRTAPGDERTKIPEAPFWACVVAEASQGQQYRVLTHAVAFPEWREAAMAFWRLQGIGALTTWIAQQIVDGDLRTREEIRRIKQERRKGKKT